MSQPQSPTPRTDAATFSAQPVWLYANRGDEDMRGPVLAPLTARCVTAAFARSLEIEIADLQARLAAANEMLARTGNASPLDFP